LSHSRWNLLPPVDKNLVNGSGLPPLAVQLLYNRGITRAEEFRPFLASDNSLANNPFLLPDMHQAVSRVYQALLSGENIAIYGDFDADGITATALLVQGLVALGGKAFPYIPHRQTEGHGLTTTVLNKLFQQGITLVITVDCGVTDALQVKKAMKMGLDVIITDHHTPTNEIPEAIAVIDPKLAGSDYPFTQLAGVGVAFKLLQALYQSIGKESQISLLTDMVAIGTIADMSPLLGENRYLIKEGLKYINNSPRLGIKELLNQNGISAGTIDAEKISWIIAPCLNAAGRLADGLTGYNLLMTESPEQAHELAAWLVQKNQERQTLTASTLNKARQRLLAEGLPPLLIADDKDYPIGVAGLVASRLREEFYRPAIIIQTGEKISHASCRSIPEFDIISALNELSHLFSRYGGHSQAAGFTFPTKNLPQIREGMLRLVAGKLVGVELLSRLDIDQQVSLPELGGDTYPTTQMLAPFGQGNPTPTFLSRQVAVVERRAMGNGGDHIRLKIKQGGTIWDAVGFRLGKYLPEISPCLDIVYHLEIDGWGGKERLRLNILDFEPSQ
jgi:single-stranded-DNA-specific exonuclease